MVPGVAKNRLESIVWTTLLFKILSHLQTCQSLSCVWRITLPPSDVQAGFVGVQMPFQVNYLDASCAQGLQWDVSSGCIVQNQSSLETSIHCYHPSHHTTIIPTVQQSCSHCVPDGRTVSVWNNPLCYRWFIQHVNKTPVWTVEDTSYGQWSLETLRVWVVDWTTSERNKSTPSQLSAALTRLFHGKGQRPLVQQVRPTNKQQLQALNATFHQDLGFWEMLVRMPVQSEMEVKITGRHEIAAGHCFIGDTTVLLTNHWLASVADEEDTVHHQLRYSPGLPTRLVQDPCASRVAILMSQSSLLFTEDSFQTAENLSLPYHLLQQGLDDVDVAVKSLAFTSTHLLLLMETRVYALYRAMTNLTQVGGLSGQFTLKGRDWCLDPSSLHRGHLAVSFNTSSAFLISSASDHEHRLISEEISLPHSVFQGLGFTAGLTLEIQDVAFQSFSNQLGFAVVATENSHSSLVFLLYDIALATWTHLPFWLDAGDTYGRVSLMFTETAQNASLLFWDQRSLYFTHQRGQYGVFTIMGSGAAMLNVSDGEVINQVCVSQASDIVVLMTSNRLYYSRIGLDTLLNLPASDLPTSSAIAFFDRLSNLIIRSDHVRTSAGDPWVWYYPLALEVQGALLNSTSSCPYKHFGHGDTCSIYYLDMNEVIQLWTSLTFPSGAGVSLKMIASSSNLLDIQAVDEWEYYPGWLAVNKTLTIQPSFNLLDPADYGQEDFIGLTGDVSVEVKPDLDDITCKKTATVVARFTVGCPPGRHIRVRAPDVCLQFSNYTIPRDAYLLLNGSDPQTSKVVQYDWSAYGCPVPSHYQQPFRPTIDLYDYDEFVTELSNNYVIFEEQHRTDFSYNASMWQAGCRSVMQTMPSRLHSSEDVTPSQSYQSCFALNATTNEEALRSQRYEVLNGTGVTSVVWSATSNNSIYQFTATVVDPGYSFCRLQTKFAVRVYGHLAEVGEKPLIPVTLAIFALMTFAVGAISYGYFRKGHIRRLKQQLVDYDTE